MSRQLMEGSAAMVEAGHEMVSHVHTAGVPGRGELDDSQELNYPAIIRAIRKTGYSGFIAQEFIPTWPEPLEALRHGVEIARSGSASPASVRATPRIRPGVSVNVTGWLMYGCGP